VKVWSASKLLVFEFKFYETPLAGLFQANNFNLLVAHDRNVTSIKHSAFSANLPASEDLTKLSEPVTERLLKALADTEKSSRNDMQIRLLAEKQANNKPLSIMEQRAQVEEALFIRALRLIKPTQVVTDNKIVTIIDPILTEESSSHIETVELQKSCSQT
jgi:hypothetical protein